VKEKATIHPSRLPSVSPHHVKAPAGNPWRRVSFVTIPINFCGYHITIDTMQYLRNIGSIIDHSDH